MSKPSVFMSYSQRDAGLAKQLADDLGRLGFNTWLDQALEPGGDWRKHILEAIEQSDVFVLLASPDGLASSWALYEAGAAQALGKRFLVLLPNSHSVSELPTELSAQPVVGFDPQSPERAAQDIASRLAA